MSTRSVFVVGASAALGMVLGASTLAVASMEQCIAHAGHDGQLESAKHGWATR